MNAFKQKLCWISVPAALSALLWLAPAEAQLIQTVDYSDTFTVAEQGGVPERTDGSSSTGSPANDVEDPHGNPVSTWTPINLFSFNTGMGSTCCGYPTNEGNDGAATGLAQSGAGDFSFAYGLRTDYVVELDGILPLDRLDVSSLPSPGAGIFSSPSLSVFFRLDSVAGTPHAAFPLTGIPGIGLYNGSVETAVTDAVGNLVKTGVNDGKWHRFAVHFNMDAGYLRFFADGRFLGWVDLNSFVGGSYRNFSNAAVGTGGAGYDFVTRVLWVDNFQVGEPATPESAACFTASPVRGVPPLSVHFDTSCSFLAAPAQSYDWDFGDGETGSGESVDHIYSSGGSYMATLTLKDSLGKTSTASRTIIVYEAVDTYSDDFQRPDGPITGWTVYSVPGTWNIAGGELLTGPTAEERFIWAGDPPIFLPGRTVISFDMRFLAPGTYPIVGRHAGAIFCGNVPTHRYDPGFSGYFVDWIDRTEDRGLRLTRADRGVLTNPVLGRLNPVPAEPPLHWRVEIVGQYIRVYGDDVLYIEVQDATYRGGLAGLWTWSNGQEVAFDNFHAEPPLNPLTACFTVGGPELPVPGKAINFDAGCTENAGAGTIVSYDWDYGDGATDSGSVVSHAYGASGDFTVKLTVKDSLGNESAVSKTVTIFQRAASFSDDFDRPDGPIDGWTVYSVPDGWNIKGGQLMTGPSSEERFIWAGDPPIAFPRNVTISWQQTFLSPGTDPVVGRHGGMVFCANMPNQRSSAGFSGYFVDWIDRTDDRGLRLSRVDQGRFVEIIRGQASIPVPAEPPLDWFVMVEDEHIRLFGDGIEYFDVVDNTHRGGLFGFWTWSGGEEVAYDSLDVSGESPSACFESAPAAIAVAGKSVKFDGGCSDSFGAPIDSYEWTFGDGSTASGITAEHSFAAPGDYAVKLTVSAGASSDSREGVLPVEESLAPFADCFERPPAPVDGWTPVLGDWNITAGEMVETTTTTAEAFLYAGDPPRPLSPEFVAQVDWSLIAGTNAAVGRHAAVNFFWNFATADRFFYGARGYSVFYIDRAADRGLTLGRWDFGLLTVLNPPGGTQDLTEPPAQLRIQVSGPRIQVFADDALKIDVEDSTYRDGLFALWVYAANQAAFDNVLLGEADLPSCQVIPPEPRFVRGDTNADGGIDVTDAVYLINFLFLGGPAPPCMDAADVDDSGGDLPEITDVIQVLNWLFLAGSAPKPPSPSTPSYVVPGECGPDPTTEGDTMGCLSFKPCAP